jgi:hypothetical protein
MGKLKTLILSFLIVMTSASAVFAGPSFIGGGCEPLLTPQYGECSDANLDNIFSGYVCQYETIVSDVFSQVYCAVRTEFQEPLQILLTLFMAIFGAAILVGAIPFTQKELILALLRIALLAGFVIQGEFVVTYIYKGVIGFIESGVEVVMSAADAGASSAGTTGGYVQDQNIYQRLDALIRDFTGSGSRESAATENHCTQSILPLMVTMMLVIPPLFLFGVMVSFQLIITFLRAVVGYLFAITCIMFLTVLSPIFLGAGLFKATRHLFTKWTDYMISFAIQVVVTFAFIGLILSMGILEDFSSLKNISVEYRANTWQPDARVQYERWCTICTGPEGREISPGRFQFTGCTDSTPVAPTGMTGFLNIARLIAMEGLNLLLLAYLINALMKLAPSIASELGNVRTAPQVSGNMFNQIAGVSSIQQAGTGAAQAFMNQSRGLPGRISESAGAGYRALLGGGTTGQNRGIINALISNVITGR